MALNGDNSHHARAAGLRYLPGGAGGLRRRPARGTFRYVDDDGESRPVESADVNAYIKEIAGDDFTSKDFRTWAGTVLCARALRALETPASATAGKRAVAHLLGTALASVSTHTSPSLNFT